MDEIKKVFLCLESNLSVKSVKGETFFKCKEFYVKKNKTILCERFWYETILTFIKNKQKLQNNLKKKIKRIFWRTNMDTNKKNWSQFFESYTNAL